MSYHFLDKQKLYIKTNHLLPMRNGVIWEAWIPFSEFWPKYLQAIYTHLLLCQEYPSP